MSSSGIRVFNNVEEYTAAEKKHTSEAAQYMEAFERAWSTLVFPSTPYSKDKTSLVFRVLASSMGVVMHWSRSSKENELLIEEHRQNLIKSGSMAILHQLDSTMVDNPSKLAEVIYYQLLVVQEKRRMGPVLPPSQLERELLKIFKLCPIYLIQSLVDVATMVKE